MDDTNTVRVYADLDEPGLERCYCDRHLDDASYAHRLDYLRDADPDDATETCGTCDYCGNYRNSGVSGIG